MLFFKGLSVGGWVYCFGVGLNVTLLTGEESENASVLRLTLFSIFGDIEWEDLLVGFALFFSYLCLFDQF